MFVLKCLEPNKPLQPSRAAEPNGNRVAAHCGAWSNRGDRNARMLFVLIDAEPIENH